MKCFECVFSKRSRSKVFGGYCSKYETHWLDKMNGCNEGKPKPVSRPQYARLYRDLLNDIKKQADKAHGEAQRLCGAGSPAWHEKNAVAGELYGILNVAETREIQNGIREERT